MLKYWNTLFYPKIRKIAKIVLFKIIIFTEEPIHRKVISMHHLYFKGGLSLATP